MKKSILLLLLSLTGKELYPHIFAFTNQTAGPVDVVLHYTLCRSDSITIQPMQIGYIHSGLCCATSAVATAVPSNAKNWEGKPLVAYPGQSETFSFILGCQDRNLVIANGPSSLNFYSTDQFQRGSGR